MKHGEAKAITSQEHPQTLVGGLTIPIIIDNHRYHGGWTCGWPELEAVDQVDQCRDALSEVAAWLLRSEIYAKRWTIGADRSGCGGWSKLGQGKVQSHWNIWNGEWSEMSDMSDMSYKVYKWCVSCPSRCIFTRLTNNCRQGLMKLTDRVNIASAGNRGLDQSPVTSISLALPGVHRSH